MFMQKSQRTLQHGTQNAKTHNRTAEKNLKDEQFGPLPPKQKQKLQENVWFLIHYGEKICFQFKVSRYKMEMCAGFGSPNSTNHLWGNFHG